MDDATRTELEAAAFRALIHHLMEARPDVQNIDLMNMAGFCRNCLGRWYMEAANARGLAMDKDAARAIVYGMPYADWVAAHQTAADAAKQAAFAEAQRTVGAGPTELPDRRDDTRPENPAAT